MEFFLTTGSNGQLEMCPIELGIGAKRKRAPAKRKINVTAKRAVRESQAELLAVLEAAVEELPRACRCPDRSASCDACRIIADARVAIAAAELCKGK